MTMLQIASLLVVLAGAFGSVNYFFLRLPASIGILVVALAASIAVMTLDRLVPGIGIGDAVRGAVMDIEFSEALLHWMLGLLLFAGALHVRADLLREQALPVALITLVGVLISTAIAGFGFAWITGFPILVAMVFGALISPTDPVAVLGVLREAKLRKSLEIQIAGESLFNDGVGYVVFLLLVGLGVPAGERAARRGLAGGGEPLPARGRGRGLAGRSARVADVSPDPTHRRLMPSRC